MPALSGMVINGIFFLILNIQLHTLLIAQVAGTEAESAYAILAFMLHCEMLLTPDKSTVLLIFSYDATDGLNRSLCKMRIGADLRGASPLVSSNHVTDPHFVTFSRSLYTTIHNPNS